MQLLTCKKYIYQDMKCVITMIRKGVCQYYVTTRTQLIRVTVALRQLALGSFIIHTYIIVILNYCMYYNIMINSKYFETTAAHPTNVHMHVLYMYYDIILWYFFYSYVCTVYVLRYNLMALLLLICMYCTYVFLYNFMVLLLLICMYCICI